MAESLAASIVPNEVVAAGTVIEVTSREPLDARSAQDAITLLGEPSMVRLSDDRRTASVLATRNGDHATGSHVLLIEEPLSDKGERMADLVRIPFFITDTKAKLPGDVRAETMVRLAVDDLRTTRVPADRPADGPFIDLFKASHRKTGEPVELCFDQDGKRVDAEEVFAGIARNRFEKFGKLHEDLYDRIESAPGEPVTVAIWLSNGDPGALPEKSPKRATPEPPDAEIKQAELMKRLRTEFAEVAQREYGAELADSEDPAAPVVVATLPAKGVRAIAERDEVTGVLLHATDAVLDLTNSMAIANSDDVQALGFDGTGVNVAVWEDGPDQVNLLPIVATFDPGFAGNSDHARHTHGIIANTEANRPHGHASGCALHSANRNGTGALGWAAATRGCTVISQSFHRSSEPGSASLQSDDVYKDWLALHWPYPTIVQAAGNFWNGDPDGINPPEDEYVNHKTFNCLTVGNHDDAASSMSGSSVFRNPSSAHGDRELPEIAANGTSVTAVGLTKSGTSMAAPAAAGCVALIQDVSPTLQSWPEGCRAIAMAGATRNPAGDDWWTDVQQGDDASDGAGAIDALEAVRITQSRSSRNGAATRRGWDVGTLRSSDIGARKETTFSYSIRTPALLFGSKAKVALAWDSVVSTFRVPLVGIELPLSSTLSVDLDLKIYDSSGNQVGYSGSYDNSYEIAEFAVAPRSTYTIKIRRWSGTDDVWYGIAWMVRGGFLIGPIEH